MSTPTRYRCCACTNLFGEAEALCEDWMDPTRSFICPHCGAHLLRPEFLGQHGGSTPARDILRFLQRWAPLVISAVLLTLTLERVLGADAALVSLVICIPFGIWYNSRFPARPPPLPTFPQDTH